MKGLFPADRLGTADRVAGLVFLAACFFLFFHGDIYGAGLDSLNYLFGSPLDFYENCKRIRGGGQNMLGTPYPPPIYAIFALWLYPFKLLGLISTPENFPLYLTYWLKTLTTLVYLASGVIFYHVAREYSSNERWAKYSAIVWLTMPLAFFSQFIFSQYDIFYVCLMLAGFLSFLRASLFRASLLFGLAITFKYFPAFAFLPLLLFFEKSPIRLAFHCAIFLAPTLLINLLYGQSPAFVEGVRNHGAIDRVFAASFDVGGWQVYLLIAAFTILCGLAYFADPAARDAARRAAHLWLASSILPFVFILWHPQWMMFVAPAIVLTTLIDGDQEKFMLLDLVGMFFFVATVCLAFQNNVDAAMFRGAWLSGFEFRNSFLMARVFDRFDGHSLGVYFSGFWGYLLLQLVLKYRQCALETGAQQEKEVAYGNVRRQLYVGSMIFILPAMFAVFQDLKSPNYVVTNEVSGKHYGELVSGRTFEQTFVAHGRAIKRISLFLATFIRRNDGDIALAVVGGDGNILGRVTKHASDIEDNAWADFDFKPPLSVVTGREYRMRLTSLGGTPGHSITWWASLGDSYKEGQAIVDGSPQNSDFGFKITFLR